MFLLYASHPARKITDGLGLSEFFRRDNRDIAAFGTMFASNFTDNAHSANESGGTGAPIASRVKAEGLCNAPRHDPMGGAPMAKRCIAKPQRIARSICAAPFAGADPSTTISQLTSPAPPRNASPLPLPRWRNW